eukprot:488888-Hanusia_phi.AAC.1
MQRRGDKTIAAVSIADRMRSSLSAVCTSLSATNSCVMRNPPELPSQCLLNNRPCFFKASLRLPSSIPSSPVTLTARLRGFDSSDTSLGSEIQLSSIADSPGCP